MRLSSSLISMLVLSLLSSSACGKISIYGVAPVAQAASAAEVKDAIRQGYCRFPTIYGDQIVFCSEDDLWTVSSEGGTARRLTAGKGVSSLPRFSPDGKLIAFVCSEEGNPEVYIMPADGGTAKRLTHLGGSGLIVCGWSPDGKNILFSTNVQAGFGKAYQLFAVSVNGGMARALKLGDAITISIARSGSVAIGRNNVDPARWKRYHGGTAGELWVGNSLDGNFKPLISLKGNLVWPQWIGDRVFFLSDHEGIGNIYSCNADGSELKRHTKELEYYVRYPSTDGKRIVYTAGARIFVLDPASGSPHAVNVVAPSNLTQAKRKFIEARDYLQQYSPHPKGHSVGLIVRGQPFIMPLFEGAVVSHGVGSKVRYEQFHWLPDGERFLVVTDAPGYHQIEIHRTDESVPPRVVTDGDIGRIICLSVAPSKNRLAFSNQRHEVYILDYETKKLQKIDKSLADRVNSLSWSPDGRWLAYPFAETISASIIKIADAEDASTHEVTSVVRNDYEPCFDPDGKYLYFLSLRDYNPVRDETQFDYSFPMAARPFLITLRKDVPSPLVPRVRPFIKDRDEDKDKDKDRDKNKGNDNDKAESSTTNSGKEAGDKDKVASKQKKKIPAVKIDFDGITGRILGLPVEQGTYRQIIALPKGKVLYTRIPVKPLSPHPEWSGEDGHSGVLASYDFDDQKETVIERDVEDAELASDNQTLVFKSKKRLRVIDATKKADDSKKDSGQESGRESGWLDLNRVKVLVEPQAEWLQMYREAWRLQKEDFWVEDMSKVDWELVRKRYEALLPLVRTRGELSDLIWEMQGELGTSHAYESQGDYEPSRSYRRGFLGADLSWDVSRKGYRIDKIYRGDSWEPEADSPLAEPGLNIAEGDFIVQVGGHPVSEDLSVDELLVDQAGQRVQLTIVPRNNNSGNNDSSDVNSSSSEQADPSAVSGKPASSSDKQRRLVVKTLKSESALRYRYWVERNRKIVHDMSKGQLGYVHIPDMGVSGFSEFHRGYLGEYRYPGLIVDLRYNGGGNVSSLLLEKLLRKRIGYGIPRYGLPEPYPYESIGGPMVAVTNQFAGSDGDIFSHAFKQYKLGPLVGKRTWGGVIGISSSRKLVDGTQTTQPEFAFWFSDVGWNVENYGVDPDVVVENTPQDFRADKDPQLDKAVELALDALQKKPFNMPEFIERPAKLLPTSLEH